MNEPILPRRYKPRVKLFGPVVRRRYKADPEQYIQYRGCICYGYGVRARGKTIEGAYKNWLSLRIAYRDIMIKQHNELALSGRLG